jgi:hypothetical protein
MRLKGSVVLVELPDVRELLRRIRKLPKQRTKLRQGRPADHLPHQEVEPYPKLFVVGAPRSGTTWVNRILAYHPSVIGTHESHLCHRVLVPLCENGHHLRTTWDELFASFDREAEANPDIGIQRYVTREVFRQIIEHGWQKVSAGPEIGAEKAAVLVIQPVLDAFFAFNRGTPRHLLVEKTPGHVLNGEFLLRRFPEARILHVIRDGRDVCVSYEMRASSAGWRKQSREEQVEQWKLYVQHGRRLAENPEWAGRVAEIRYEDLRRGAGTQIQKLYELAGLPAQSGFAKKIARRTDFSRYRNSGTGMHNRKGIVGDWRNHFSVEDEALFRRLASDVFLDCGYTFDDPPLEASR